MSSTAACSLSLDYAFACGAVGAGGTKIAYIIEAANVDALVQASGVVTAITKSPGKVFRKYQLVQDTAVFDEAIVKNIQNGTLAFTQTGTIIINRQQVAVRNEMLLLAKTPVYIVIKDNNGDARIYGYNGGDSDGMQLNTGAVTTGTTLADRNGYTLTFTFSNPNPALFVSDTVMGTLQTPGS